MAGKPENDQEAGLDVKMLNTRLPKELIKKVKLYCVANDMTIQTFVAEALEEKLKK